MRIRVDGQDVERVSAGEAETFALTDSEALDALVMADDLAGGADEFAGGVGERFALLVEVGLEEGVVVAAGDEADLLRVRLLRDGETGLGCHLADFRLGISPKGKSVRESWFCVRPKRK